MSATKDAIKTHPQADLVAALECLMYESWDGMPEDADKTDIRLHYITAILRHFDVTPKRLCGYRPDLPVFSDYRGDRRRPIPATLPPRMREAADVIHEATALFRKKYPTSGFSANEPISESSMRRLADQWEAEDLS